MRSSFPFLRVHFCYYRGHEFKYYYFSPIRHADSFFFCLILLGYIFSQLPLSKILAALLPFTFVRIHTYKKRKKKTMRVVSKSLNFWSKKKLGSCFFHKIPHRNFSSYARKWKIWKSEKVTATEHEARAKQRYVLYQKKKKLHFEAAKLFRCIVYNFTIQVKKAVKIDSAPFSPYDKKKRFTLSIMVRSVYGSEIDGQWPCKWFSL